MMKLSLSQAAKEIGVSKPTLSRWVKGGKISGVKLNDGSYEIDLSEVDRIVELKQKAQHKRGNNVTEMLRPETASESMMLRREIELLREQLEDKAKTIEDLQKDRDYWRQQATALLPKPRPFWPWSKSA